MDTRLQIDNIDSLFSLPEMALKVNELIQNADPDFQELEDLIIHDPALTATILKLVNSAFFGFPGRIDKISRAISMIGLKDLQNLVMSTAVITRFQGLPYELVDMDVFWYHSVTCASIAKILAKKYKKKDYERFFICGLLHSLGKLIYFVQCPDVSVKILKYKDKGAEVVLEAEKRLLGINHAELGAMLLQDWGLPNNIYQVIADHLQPFNSKEYKEDACLLHIAGSLADSIEPCAKFDFDYEQLEPSLDAKVVSHMQLTPNLVQYSMDEGVQQAYDVLTILNPRSTMIF